MTQLEIENELKSLRNELKSLGELEEARKKRTGARSKTPHSSVPLRTHSPE